MTTAFIAGVLRSDWWIRAKLQCMKCSETECVRLLSFLEKPFVRSEPTHLHPHRQVLPFNVVGRNVVPIRGAASSAVFDYLVAAIADTDRSLRTAVDRSPRHSLRERGEGREWRVERSRRCDDRANRDGTSPNGLSPSPQPSPNGYRLALKPSLAGARALTRSARQWLQ